MLYLLNSVFDKFAVSLRLTHYDFCGVALDENAKSMKIKNPVGTPTGKHCIRRQFSHEQGIPIFGGNIIVYSCYYNTFVGLRQRHFLDKFQRNGGRLPNGITKI